MTVHKVGKSKQVTKMRIPLFFPLLDTFLYRSKDTIYSWARNTLNILKWQKRSQNSGAISLQVKLKVVRVTSQVRMHCADKAQKQCNCQGHNRTATFSVLWINLLFQRGTKSFLSRISEALFPTTVWYVTVQELMWVSTAAITELNNTFPHIRNNIKFPAFLQQLTQEWLLLSDFLFSSCSSGRKHLFCRGLFCHWSTFATQIPLVSLAGKRHAHAHTGAWVWTEAFKKQSSRLFLGHKLALWLLSCKTGPGGLLWHMIAVQNIPGVP